MKADMTRDTFHPLKHFARVLMQQGRVQLDADWNEQAAILLGYLQALAADLVGPAGGPENNYGFAISRLTQKPNTGDFQIGFGHYYVDGLLCRADSVPIAIFPTATAGIFQVRNWSSDFELQPIPSYEVFDYSPFSPNPPAPVTITSTNRALSQITIQTIPPAVGSFLDPRLRRVISYQHQPDFVFSTLAGALSPLPLPAGFSQIYLDVWERVITYAEDDRIREVALGGPDTAARTKLVWQVKSIQPAGGGGGTPGCMTLQQLYGLLQPANRGWLQAMAKQRSPSTNPCIISPSARYSGPENQLYRVEINRAGAAWDGTNPNDTTAATFKWSRENGSVFYPIVSGGGTTAVVVESLGRDDRLSLTEGDLVEVQDDRAVLLNEAGRLLPVQSVDGATMTVTLGGTSDAVLGSDDSFHPLLRRWDQTAGDPAEGGLTLANDNAAFVQEGVWLALENGVQIRFQPADPVQSALAAAVVNQYRTADYWLIPARTASGDVEWPRVTDAKGIPETDAQGNLIPIALPPHGVTHHYAPLAVISSNVDGVSPVTDCRSPFDSAVDAESEQTETTGT